MCVGIGIVNVLMNLIGHPSQKYGIPFPVMARLSFGVMGANMAAMIRGVVGIVWYGVQTYFASKAVEVLALTLAPEFAESYNDNDIYGLTTLAWGSFIFMWFFQLIIFLAGMEAIRTFIDLCGPIVYLVMFLLAGYMINRAGMDVFKMSLHEGEPLKGIAAIGMMLQAAMLIVSYFSALLLNFGDFARFAKSDAAMKSGNFWGLPVNFVTFALIVVIVVGGSQKVFGEAIMDPVLVVEKIGNPLVSVVGSITFIVATMGINIVANFVSPACAATHFSHAPSRLRPRLHAPCVPPRPPPACAPSLHCAPLHCAPRRRARRCPFPVRRRPQTTLPTSRPSTSPLRWAASSPRCAPSSSARGSLWAAQRR